MTLTEIVREAINPALSLLPPRMTSDAAMVELLAIGLQESRFEYRRQIKGPARGFWQFERGGGVRGVMRHSASRPHAYTLCNARGIPFDEATVYRSLEMDDVLAAGFARLLLFTDPNPIPENDPQAGWDYYVRNWRPGKPHRQTWDAFYVQASAFVRSGKAAA